MGDLSIFEVNFIGLGEKLLRRVKEKEGLEWLSDFSSKKLDKGQSLLREGRQKGDWGPILGLKQVDFEIGTCETCK